MACMITESHVQNRPPLASPLILRVLVRPDPDAQRLADLAYGTLSPHPSPGAVELRAGLHFTPAWDPAEEARASVLFLDMRAEAAEQASLMNVQQAARRRGACGVDWTYQRLSVQAVNTSGETLACRSVGGVASDLEAELRAGLIEELRREAHEEALDWYLLGLN